MGASVRFEPEVVREEEFRNAQEPIEEVFDEAGRSCVRLLWAALASKFGKKGAGGGAGQGGNVEKFINLNKYILMVYGPRTNVRHC